MLNRAVPIATIAPITGETAKLPPVPAILIPSVIPPMAPPRPDFSDIAPTALLNSSCHSGESGSPAKFIMMLGLYVSGVPSPFVSTLGGI